MDSGDGHIVWSVAFFAVLIVDFLLAAFGAAIQSVSEASLDSAEGIANIDDLRSLADEPRKLINACWFYMILTAWPAFVLVEQRAGWQRHLMGILLMISVYLFGTALPRVIGKKYKLAYCRVTFPVLRRIIQISLPVMWILSLITDGIARLIGIRPRDLEEEVTEDEILSMVNEGHEQGVLDEHEAEMIQNIFQLDDTQARDIMTHRTDITAIDGNMNLSEAISFMVEETNSRFPVYESHIDEIIGVLHFKDAMIFQHKGGYADWKIKDIPGLLREVSFIPETRNIDELFHTMQARKIQMVIVVDEYGETAGLVTMEDILEEIVGNILDEYDEDDHFILKEGEDIYLMAGKTPIDEVGEVLDTDISCEDYDTLNGYLVSLLDHIPEQDERSCIRSEGWDFTIEEVQDRMIKWVRVTRAAGAGGAEADGLTMSQSSK